MADYHRPNAKTVQELNDIANKIRIHSIESTDASASGHPTSCASCAEILSVLFFNEMKYSVKEPRHPAADRFIMSKGHACPALYAAWAEAGLFPASDLLKLRKIESDLEGHPTPRLNFIDVATGSLGQGLSCAAGMAWVGKNLDKADYRVYCLIGDGESAEGSIWEALSFSSHYKLDNLVAIFDVNRLGQSEPTAFQHDLDTYKNRLEAFGWNTLVVDGHDVEALAKAFHSGTTVSGKPTAIVCKTFKGQGYPEIEDVEGWHGKPLGKKSASVIEHIRGQIVNQNGHGLCPTSPSSDLAAADISNMKMSEPPNYKKGDKVAPRFAYGVALAKLGKANPRVVAMDGDTKNSTFADKFKAVCPERYVECFIAEQNLVGVAIGAACRDRTVAFVSTFAAFLSRAYDQIRMGAVSQTNVNFSGSHCGVSIGADGPSQMALEDLGMFRAIPGATVFYPSDAVSTERAVELSANTKGVCFLRSSRPNMPVLYDNDEEFVAGKAKVVRQSEADQLTVVGAGITLHEAMKAAEQLSGEGINLRVVDPFTIKPMDVDTLVHCAKATGGKILTVEDHYLEGGIGEAVCSALSEYDNIKVMKIAVNSVPRSGTPEELLALYKIDAAGIVEAAKAFLKA